MIQSLVHSFNDLLFPPLCFHCDTQMENPNYPFCESCLSLFERPVPNEHCSKCNSPLLGHGSHCPRWTRPYFQVVRCFETIGPPAVLAKLHRSGFYPKTTQLIASLLIIESERRKLPPPNLITSYPRSQDHDIAQKMETHPSNEPPTIWVIASQIDEKKHYDFGKKLLKQKPKQLILFSLT